MTKARFLAALTLMTWSAGAFVTEAAAAEGEALTLSSENDILTGSDNNFTNGIGVTWVSGDLERYGDDRFVSKWGDFWSFLPFVGDEGYRTYASWTLGQEMHTPHDITIPVPPVTDQPYAGILNVDSVLYARSGRWAHAWELKLGLVGPDSQADDLQDAFHSLVGGDEPMGWDTQLPNEPIVNIGLTTAYLWKEGSAGGSARWRLVPMGHVGVGTYYTGAGLGMYGEIGWNLVDALGGTSLREGLTAATTVGVGPVDLWSVSFFGGFGGHATAHYLPLDGTVFRDSRSVDSKSFVRNASLGMNVRHGRLVLNLAATFTTDAFESQEESAEFGSLSASWFFQ
jgi:hypothetical protein